MKYLKEKIKQKLPNVYKLYLEYASRNRYSKMQPILTKFGFKLAGMSSMQEGTFEEEETQIIIKEFNNINLFVDIGANIGYFTCLAKKYKIPTISIEPLSDNLRILYSNLQINNWIDSEVVPVGLGEKPMILDLYGENTGASLISNWGGENSILKRTISISTLDNILNGRFVDEKLFIKMDVEGYEYEALKGSLLTIKRKVKPIWLIEICFTELFPNGINPHYFEIFDLFWQNGYTVYTADKEQNIIESDDIKRWIKNNKRDVGYTNFIFK